MTKGGNMISSSGQSKWLQAGNEDVCGGGVRVCVSITMLMKKH